MFAHGNAEKISELTNEKFDYAVFSLCPHEMESKTRAKTLDEIKKITNKVTIYDYMVKKNFFTGNNEFSC